MLTADARVMERLEGMRSKVECATYCYANRTCRTAVYQHDGDCILISNFTDWLTYTPVDNSVYADQIIEMRSATAKSNLQDTVMLALNINESQLPIAIRGPVLHTYLYWQESLTFG